MMGVVSTDSSGDHFATIARDLSKQAGVAATLENATATAMSIVEGCDHAGISMVVKRRVEPVAATDDTIVLADALQHELAEGPCLQSIADHETVYSRDLRTEPRWPRWAPRVADELGLRSALAVQLFVGPTALGALNLFSDTPDAFSPADRATAVALAAHIAVAMCAAQDQQEMDSALIHRTVIGQAEGMLMQALDVSPERAFAVLIRVSQARNTKLHLVAAGIVKNGIRAELL